MLNMMVKAEVMTLRSESACLSSTTKLVNDGCFFLEQHNIFVYQTMEKTKSELIVF